MTLATCAVLAALVLAHPAGAAAADAPARTPDLQLSLTAAEAGDAAAMAELGEQYQTGNGAVKDLGQALIWYRKAAEAGNGAGMAGLGSLYFFGAGVTKDELQARGWFEKAAAAGNARGVNGLALLYANGLAGLPKDPAKAVAMYEQAARAGDKRAMMNLADFYYGNENEPVKDPERAVFWARQAAEAGITRGMLILSDAYMEGTTGVAKNGELALSWLQRAADAGDTTGMMQVGDAYSTGKGVARSHEQAFAWQHKAAEQGHPRGMINTAFRFEKGVGVARSQDQAATWARKAIIASAGDATLLAQIRRLCLDLARTYQAGPNVVPDEAREAFWLIEAAEAGDPAAMTQAGRRYASGTGVAQSDEQALAWYRKAGAADPTISPQLGKFYAIFAAAFAAGTADVKQSDVHAAFWRRQAAEEGDRPSMQALGVAFFYGRGVPKDLDQAAKWFRRGAEAGDVQSMLNLAVYYSGQMARFWSGRDDMENALLWSGKAAAAGNVDAMYLLASLYDLFPPRGGRLMDNETMRNSEEKAFAWYQKAAEAGDARAAGKVQERLKEIQQADANKGSGFQWGKAAALLTGATIGGLGKLAPAAKAAIVTGIVQDSMAGQEGAGRSLAAVGGLQAAQAQKVVAAGPAAADRDALGDPYPRITVSFECYDTGGGGPGAEPAADGPCLQQERLAKGVQCRADWPSHAATRELYRCAAANSTGRFKRQYEERLAWVNSNIERSGLATGVGHPAPPATPLAPANRSDVQHDLPSVTPCNHDERGACGTPK